MDRLDTSIAATLKSAREKRGLSQRDLGKMVGVPQGHISNIEGGSVDLRLSSLIALSRALDLELTLVPRKALPAVQSIVGNLEPSSQVRARPAYSLDEDDDHG